MFFREIKKINFLNFRHRSKLTAILSLVARHSYDSSLWFSMCLSLKCAIMYDCFYHKVYSQLFSNFAHESLMVRLPRFTLAAWYIPGVLASTQCHEYSAIIYMNVSKFVYIRLLHEIYYINL